MLATPRTFPRLYIKLVTPRAVPLHLPRPPRWLVTFTQLTSSPFRCLLLSQLMRLSNAFSLLVLTAPGVVHAGPLAYGLCQTGTMLRLLCPSPRRWSHLSIKLAMALLYSAIRQLALRLGRLLRLPLLLLSWLATLPKDRAWRYARLCWLCRYLEQVHLRR